jgi:signal transduction histidine kinase/ActR/RegA family two-component response regulator
MNLKQKTFFFVGLSVAALLVVYLVFSNYYIRQQETRFFDDRQGTAQAIADEFTGFFTRGIERLNLVATLPALTYGLQSLEDNREGRHIPTWTTLHYLFYESDIFTEGVYLLNEQGKVLWSEPPNQDLLETVFHDHEQIFKKIGNPPAEAAFVVTGALPDAEILVSSPLTDVEGRMVGALVGAIPVSHPAIARMLQRNPPGSGTAQLVDESRRVIASTDPKRQLQPYPHSSSTMDVIVATGPVAPMAWTVAVDQNAAEALAGIESLKTLLTAFGIVFTLIAMASLLFILRSFTRPVEVLTEAARRIGDGDLSGGFTLDRDDEIGILGKTLDDMKTKLKSSYELLLQSEKMALMGQVVAGIAHELNNPLTIVIGNVQLLMMREVNQRNLQSLSRIRDGAERASKIVKNLLTFARQEKPERKPTDINAVLRKTLELRAYELKVSNIEVSTEFALELPETMADPHQLQQVFLNLIVNAEHAMLTSHGKGLLRLSTRAEGGKILIFFSDDGPGIPKENIRRVFEPFFTTKAVGKGTGLGLSICQGIVDEHGGRIDVESTIGRGATFVIELPVLRWIPDPIPVSTTVQGRIPTVTRKKILVVEDELQIRQLFEEVLRAQGHDVDTANNGRVALELVDKTNYDLIISDVKMPEVSGPDFYAALQRKGTALERRVIFVTGDLMNPETLQFIESTGRAWLGKPFDIDSITRTISDCLNSIQRT